MTKVTLSEDIRQKIGMVLNREILPIEEGNVSSFEGFSDRDVNDFRLLESRSGILAISYIRYRLESKVALDVVVSFLSTIVIEGIPIHEWVRPRSS